MSKSAFEKWHKKNKAYHGRCQLCKDAWLAALRWALRQKDKRCCVNNIDSAKIRAEIKKVEREG